MSHSESEEIVGLRPEVRWNLKRRLPGFVFAVSVAGLGGFLGGLMMSWGPQYLSIHVTEAVQEIPMQAASASVRTPPPVEVVFTPESTEEVESLPEGAEARLVVQSKKHSYVLLAQGADPATMGTGKKRVSGKDFRFTLTQKVKEDSLTPETGLWRERELTLFSKRGYVCSARVAEFVLLQQSDEEGDDPRSVLRDWDPMGVSLAARLEPIRGNCKAAAWARDASLPAPALGYVGKASKETRRLARTTFRQDKAWRELQSEFRAGGGQGKWDEQFDSKPTVRSLRGPSEELIFVAVNTEGCGEFGAALSALYRVGAEGELEELANLGFMTDVALTADIDLDGDLDLIGYGDRSDVALVEQQEGTLHELFRSSALMNYCGC